ncbi:RND family efflux transporter MFP subunit [Salinibacter ruber]|uniref:efflux RND transporter periplasmic adaptor subunit n=1 Tax=Salinibacter ruber TaxID=146919 RepID=UPI002168E013|nr:efflux RND transporter periplasmic adaptor subunit [Salinibacter ruber]MCS3861266.1 RND family efflux transporter MFP subunit [Salinibacter ruber]
MHRRLLRPLVLVFAPALFLIGCGEADAPPSTATAETPPNPNVITLSKAELEEVGVETVKVTEHPVTTTLELPARVRPAADQEAFVTSLVDGRVERLRVSPGTRVAQGEVVADVAAPDLSRMVADLRQARSDLDRQRRLDERGVAVEKNVRAAERNWQAARQRLRSVGVRPARIEQVATGARDMRTLPLEAPLDGIVLNRMGVLGAPVQQGDTLYRIVDLQPIRVVARVFEQSLDKVRTGQPATITTPMAPRSYQGTIGRIIPQVGDESRAASARIVLDNTDGTLRPGMYASVQVQRTGAPQAALPADVLLTDDSGAYVLVRDGPRRFRRVHVDADAETDGDVAVPSLDVGTKVVTQGAYQIVSALNQSR